MGCDIHMYAERYNREDRKWEKVGNEFLSDYSIYFITKHIENEIGCDTKLAENILISILMILTIKILIQKTYKKN